jgi:replication fork protection complex subunit Csm3/Swi3
MPASLDDIWDAPADAAPPRAAAAPGSDDGLPPTSRRRATQPLFLDSDSDGEAGPSSRPRARSKAASAPDIDHLFDGLGDDDDDGLPKTPARERASSPFTPHAVLPSSSPPRDGWKDSGDGDKDKAGVSAGADKKRRLPKLDDARLLGPDGFPALLKQTRGFVPKGKGHEVRDPSPDLTAHLTERASNQT